MVYDLNCSCVDRDSILFRFRFDCGPVKTLIVIHKMNKKISSIAKSPLGSVIKIALVILGGEFVIMMALEGILKFNIINDVPVFLWQFLDPVLLTLLVAPALQFLVLNPMKAQQVKLEQQKDELAIAAVTFNAQEGMVVTDVNHRILKVNRAFSEVTGYSSEEAVGKTPAILQSGKQDEAFYRSMLNILERDKYWQGEIWNRRKNGKIYPEWLTITTVSGEKGNTYHVGIFSDITERKVLEEKISFLAYHDQLTGLPSRTLFYDRLSRGISQSRRNKVRLALCFLDLDGFKAINDNHGHEAGDEVLKATAKRLLACVREVDTVCRLGGDEFAIVLGDVELSTDVRIVAQKIIQNLNEPIVLKGGLLCNIGVSIGIAIYPDDGAEIDRLMSAADSAMYTSKAAGKNTFTFASAEDRLGDRPWIVINETHLLGIEKIDQQHIELVSKLNNLNVAVRNNEPCEVILRLFDDFAVQIRAHFKHEDALMKESGYSDNEAHRAEHHRLVGELEYLKGRFDSGGELLALQSLKEWLLGHVQGLDRKFADFLYERNSQ